MKISNHDFESGSFGRYARIDGHAVSDQEFFARLANALEGPTAPGYHDPNDPNDLNADGDAISV